MTKKRSRALSCPATCSCWSWTCRVRRPPTPSVKPFPRRGPSNPGRMEVRPRSCGCLHQDTGQWGCQEVQIGVRLVQDPLRASTIPTLLPRRECKTSAPTSDSELPRASSETTTRCYRSCAGSRVRLGSSLRCLLSAACFPTPPPAASFPTRFDPPRRLHPSTPTDKEQPSECSQRRLLCRPQIPART